MILCKITTDNCYDLCAVLLGGKIFILAKHDKDKLVEQVTGLEQLDLILVQ